MRINYLKVAKGGCNTFNNVIWSSNVHVNVKKFWMKAKHPVVPGDVSRDEENVFWLWMHKKIPAPGCC